MIAAVNGELSALETRALRFFGPQGLVGSRGEVAATGRRGSCQISSGRGLNVSCLRACFHRECYF